MESDSRPLFRFPIHPTLQMRTRLTPIFLSIICLVFAGCSSKSTDSRSTDSKDEASNNEAAKKDEGKPKTEIPVKVAQAERGAISSFLEFDSILETESAIDIHSESSGLVTEVLAEVGDVIESGQILARLENEDEQINVKESLSRYTHLQSKFKRVEDLFSRSLINQQEYDTEKFDLEQSEISYERARIRLEDTIIRAPVEGIVSIRHTQVGERVTTSNKLFTLMNPKELFAQVSIPGQHLLSIRKGLPAEIVSEIIEGISYAASVKLVSPTIDPASGTCSVKVMVDDNGSMPIYPGMFVSVRLVLDTKADVVLVPKGAIVHEGERTFIYKVEDSIARKMPFEFGYENSDNVESIAGVEYGDSIIVLGHNALKDGATVKVVNDAYSATNDDTPSPSESTEG